MNKIVKKFDVNKMTEFEPSEVTSSEDELDLLDILLKQEAKMVHLRNFGIVLLSYDSN